MLGLGFRGFLGRVWEGFRVYGSGFRDSGLGRSRAWVRMEEILHHFVSSK